MEHFDSYTLYYRPEYVRIYTMDEGSKHELVLRVMSEVKNADIQDL